MSHLVCDRCGRPEGECRHYGEPDYAVQTVERYERETRIIAGVLRGLLLAGFGSCLVLWAFLK